MKTQLMRSFAGGLLLSTSICGIVYLFGSNNVQSAKMPLEDEMIRSLTADGYVVQTEEEWKTQMAANKTPKENLEKGTTVAEPPQEKVVYRTILSVSKGMTSIDIGKTLKSTHIIDQSVSFSKEVEKRGLSNKLRPRYI